MAVVMQHYLRSSSHEVVTLCGRQAYLRVARMLGWCSSLHIRASSAGVISGVSGVSMICKHNSVGSRKSQVQVATSTFLPHRLKSGLVQTVPIYVTNLGASPPIPT